MTRSLETHIPAKIAEIGSSIATTIGDALSDFERSDLRPTVEHVAGLAEDAATASLEAGRDVVRHARRGVRAHPGAARLAIAVVAVGAVIWMLRRGRDVAPPAPAATADAGASAGLRPVSTALQSA